MKVYKAKDGFFYATSLNDAKKLILKKLVFDEKEKSWKGKLTPPDKDMELTATVTITREGKLKVFAKKLFVSKTIYFTKSN